MTIMMKNGSFTLTKIAASVLFATISSLSMNAQQIGVDEAQQIAADFFAESMQYPSKSRHAVAYMGGPELAYTAKTGDVTDFYVFNNSASSNGFVIVAGNHEQPDILGYSMEGTFDMENAPENFKWWMEQYQQTGTIKRKVTKKFWHDVEPLIKTIWGQTEPFNNAIPHLSNFQPFVTGCTSTAIAQVMNYYQHPLQGKGSESYQITYNGDDKLKVTFSADFGKSTYDWNNMLDDYSNGYTKTQADAVATLVYHVGVAERTSYSDADHGSSASLHNGAIAMIEHFDYDQSMETANRKSFTDEDWERMIYQELENERPVLYSGRDASNGGHSFIVHGYDAEKGLYAINWGWAGFCDGYYTLTGANSLSPHYGDNYVGDRYNYDQTIYFNIKPNEGGQSVPIISTWDQVLLCTMSSNTSINNYELDRSNDEDVTLRLQFTPWNSGLCAASFLYGIMFINRENGHTINPDGGNVGSASLGVNQYYSYRKSMPFNTSMLQYNGVYEVWPAYSVDNGETWHPMPTDITKGVPTITVQGGVPKTAYTLTYLVDGEVYEKQKMESGVNITAEKEPTKVGYTFSGWSEIPETMPDKDVIVTGTFIPNKYKLTYVVDGNNFKIVEVAYGSDVVAEDAPAKEGYTFSGWSEIPATMPAKDVMVTGSFSINTYTLTYIIDGVTYKISEVEYGAAIKPETEPIKEGYTFSGWSVIPAIMPAKEVVVTGSFTINKYKLTYMVDDKTYKTFEVEYGASIAAESEPVKDGYNFSGWSEIPAAMPARDVTVTGTFTINKYNLTYMIDGVTYKTSEVEYGTVIKPELEPIKEGYTFSGWGEVPITMPAKDVTMTGRFTINKYKLVYMVDDETYKFYEVEYGATITAEGEPTREGYTFSGWSEIPATMPAKDVTVTGSFTKGEYQLTYVVDGQTYKTIRMDYGDAITPEAAPEKEGCTFSGWSEIPATMPAKDATVTGTFVINKYALTYQVDGEIYKTYEVEYGTNITAEVEPYQTGCTFSGWSEIPATMPARDVTITGSFAVNNYTLTYQVDGEIYKTYDIEYGANITTEAEPTKEVYTFSGWSEVPATMPAHDVTITGNFTFIDAIEDITANDSEYQIFTIDGTPVETLQEGVNIIKYKDGTSKKVVVK